MSRSVLVEQVLERSERTLLFSIGRATRSVTEVEIVATIRARAICDTLRVRFAALVVGRRIVVPAVPARVQVRIASLAGVAKPHTLPAGELNRRLYQGAMPGNLQSGFVCNSKGIRL